ncbi:HAD hydrolase-like protein [Streptomyces syringium]|uniref:HAD hydrolase-like protein n=1 Tax=Streptomyces syringium TaxID=76729 RepID=UPI0037D656EE
MSVPARVELVSLDVGYTLGEPAGTTLTQRLVALSPLPSQQAKRLAQEHLHTALPGDTDAVTLACEALRISPEDFPHEHQPPDFTWWPGAVECVAVISHASPVVTMSNVTSWDDRGDVARHLGPCLTAHYPSWRLGFAKPDPRALRAVAARHGVPVSGLVHVGDSLDYDVLGALAAGAQAIWITSGDRAAQATGLLKAHRRQITVAPDLRTAAGHLRAATAAPPILT